MITTFIVVLHDKVVLYVVIIVLFFLAWVCHDSESFQIFICNSLFTQECMCCAVYTVCIYMYTSMNVCT